jgi:hypothetical protein
MTTTIHIEYEGKAARLPLQSPKRTTTPPAVQRRTGAGAVNNVRIFNAARRVDPKAITSEEIAAGDPELDFSIAGSLANPDLLSMAFIDKSGNVVRDFEEIEVVLAPDGTEKERRPRTDRAANINDLRPIKVGKFMPVEEALTSFVFRGVYQIVHEDGLGHDFLRGLAEKLEKDKVVAVLGAGQKGNQPLVLREGGSPYRAFLHGETGKDGTYRLLVLLSNQELKLPA